MPGTRASIVNQRKSHAKDESRRSKLHVEIEGLRKSVGDGTGSSDKQIFRKIAASRGSTNSKGGRGSGDETGTRSTRKTMRSETSQVKSRRRTRATRNKTDLGPEISERQTVKLKGSAYSMLEESVVSQHEIKEWQAKCKKLWQNYYREGRVQSTKMNTSAHQCSLENSLDPASGGERKPCIHGCGFMCTGLHPTACCPKCHAYHQHHGYHGPHSHHSKMCSQEREASADDTETCMISYFDQIPAHEKWIYSQAHHCSVLQKLSAGAVEDILPEDVSELFDVLLLLNSNVNYDKEPQDEDENEGKIPLSSIQILLTHCLEPPAKESEVNALFGDFSGDGNDKDQHHDFSNRFVTVAELHRMFTTSKEVKKFLELRRKHHPPILREYLVEHVAEVVDREDYLSTLPVTLLSMIIFMYVALGHLQIYDRFKQESSLATFANGRDPGETCDIVVQDMDSFWTWLGDYGLRAPFANVKQSSYNSSWDHINLASRNTLVGDAQLFQRKFGEETRTQTWLRTTSAGKAVMENGGSYEIAAKTAAEWFRSQGGDHPDIYENWLSYNTYNEESRMFSQVTVYVPMDEFGYVNCMINVDAVAIETVGDWSVVVFDVLFVGLLLRGIWSEGLELCHAAKYGFGEFLDYWEFWNIIDWITIVCRLEIILAWVILVFAMNADELNSLIDSSTGKLKVDVMTLDQTQLQGVYDAVERLTYEYFYLKVGFAVNCVVIVFKFFKAFNSNPRLKVVQATFEKMSIDITHFFIIFTTIFLPFAFVGHLLFGHDIPEFASTTASISTGFSLMMGEQGWFADINDGLPFKHVGITLTSGKPTIFLVIWYVCYMVIVVQMLFNMVLAIILDKYLAIKDALQHEVDAPPIWIQIQQKWRMREYRKQMGKGYVPLPRMLALLENDGRPAHNPEEFPNVTSGSLMTCFPGVCPFQAVWLMVCLEIKREIEDERAENNDDDDKFEKMEEDLRTKIDEILEPILLQASRESHHAPGDDERASRIEKLLTREERQEIYESGREKTLSLITKSLEKATVGLQKLRRDQQKLTQKINQLQDATSA